LILKIEIIFPVFKYIHSLFSDHQPVYEIPPEKYSAEQILKFYSILILKVCKGKPRDITSSATYVVDTSYLDSIDDVKKDEFGIWRYMGSHPQSFKVFIDEDGEINIEKCSKNSSGSNISHLRRLHCCHPSNSDFKRTICYISGWLDFKNLISLIY
jgi:hypothetical protein